MTKLNPIGSVIHQLAISENYLYTIDHLSLPVCLGMVCTIELKFSTQFTPQNPTKVSHKIVILIRSECPRYTMLNHYPPKEQISYMQCIRSLLTRGKISYLREPIRATTKTEYTLLAILGKSKTKYMVISSQGLLGMGKGVYKLEFCNLQLSVTHLASCAMLDNPDNISLLSPIVLFGNILKSYPHQICSPNPPLCNSQSNGCNS